MVSGDFPAAETILNRASEFDASSPIIPVLLAYSQLMDQHLDDAIVNSRRAHALRGSHAIAHHVAARALEQKGRTQEAIGELETFLKEEPSGRRAESARKELAGLHVVHAKAER
jgi:Flp pilus assembly protein TadD